MKRKHSLCICISMETALGRRGFGPLWSEGHEVRCLAAGQRLLQQQFARNGVEQENRLQRPLNLPSTGTRNSWVSLSQCPASLMTLLSCALANGPPLSSSPSLYKGLCHGTGDADIRERTIGWTAAGPGAGKNRRKAFPLCSLDEVESIPIRQGWLHLSSINHTD